MALIFGVGSITAEAAVRRARFGLIELGCFVADAVGAGEGEAVHGGVGVADETQGFAHGSVAVLIDGFAEQEDGMAVVRGLLTKLRDGEGDSIEDGGAVVSRLEVVELFRG